MWHVILDSNAVILDLRPKEDGWARLLRAVHAGRVRVYLPEIVVDELSAHRPSVHQPDVANAVRAVRALRAGRLDGGAARLLGGGEGFTILPYPQVSHREVAARALARRRPFDALGHDGYRDTLVWETVLALARTLPGARLALVSRNHKDFAGDAGTLHAELVHDVDALGAGTTVELVRDVATLVARA